jgi:Fur family ferric uptake transcriptional regulator
MRWADALRRSGHRVTAPTRAVLSALFAADAPTTAEQIADGLGGRLPTLDFTLVDRNLERVEQLGFVGHVHLGHGLGLYALARDGDSEYLGCEQCGRVTAVDTADLDPVRETVRRTFGYDVRFSDFPLHGHCPGLRGQPHEGGRSGRTPGTAERPSAQWPGRTRTRRGLQGQVTERPGRSPCS